MRIRKVRIMDLVLLIMFASSLFFSGMFVVGQKHDQKAPPFHTGGALFPEPKPATPPGGILTAGNAMMLLAAPKNFSAARISSFARNGLNLDTVPIPLGGEEVTIADIKGPGAITHIWTTFKGGGRDLIIRFYWDGNEYPSIEAPIGDFFGVALGFVAPMSSYPIQCTSMGRSRNCWWYMPFNKSAKVTLSNLRPPDYFEKGNVPVDGADVPIRHRNRIYYYIDYQVYNEPIKDIRFFHARFKETDPPERGKPVNLVEIEGEGHYVGLVLGHRTRTPGWFGEGDDIITVDGQLSFVGTGTEDYFCDAWGFRVHDEPFFGAPVYEGREIGDGLSIYRFHITDPIPFRKSFTFDIEHWPWISEWPNTGRGYYSSLGFWYQKGFHKPWPRLEKLVSDEPWDPAKGRWHVKDALEAEDLGVLSYKSRLGERGRPESRFLMPNQSGDYMLAFDSGGQGEFSLGVPVQDEGMYKVKIHYLRAPDYGIVQLRVNDKAIGEPIDLFRAFVEMFPRPIWPPKEFVFPTVFLRSGLNTFTFSVDSKNPESDGYKCGIDCIVLEREKN
jgi:hypothetical protein